MKVNVKEVDIFKKMGNDDGDREGRSIIEYGILEELKTFKRRLEFESRKFVTAKTELNPDFPHESELIKKQARLSELNQKLSA